MKNNIIGSDVVVTESDNLSQKGIKGKIIDETRNTILIQTKEKNIKLIKNQITIMIDDKEIKGNELIGKPEERIKKSR